MHNLNDAFSQLKSNCEVSTTLMLVKALHANHLSLSALAVFDEIADFPPEAITDALARSKVVADLLSQSLTSVASQGDTSP